MDSPAAKSSPEQAKASPEQVEVRRKALRQETVENHRLLRRLGDEDAELVAEIAELREEAASVSADGADAAAGKAREQQARAEARLAVVRGQIARTRERASAVMQEASGLLQAAARAEPSDNPAADESSADEAPAPGVPIELHAQRAMARTNKILHREIGVDMRAFIRGSPGASVEEWAAQSVWAKDTGGARDERGLSLRVREGDWKRLFEAALLDPEGDALGSAQEEARGGAEVGRRYRCLTRAAATPELEADAADPSLAFSLLDAGMVLRCDAAGISMDGRQRLRCEHGWVSLIAMDGQELLAQLTAEEEQQLEEDSAFGFLLQKKALKIKQQVESLRAEAKAMLEPEPEPEPELGVDQEEGQDRPEEGVPPASASGSSEPSGSSSSQGGEVSKAISSAETEAKAALGSLMRWVGEITEKPPLAAGAETVAEKQPGLDWRLRLPAGGSGGGGSEGGEKWRLPAAAFLSRGSKDADDDDQEGLEAVRGDCGKYIYLGQS